MTLTFWWGLSRRGHPDPRGHGHGALSRPAESTYGATTPLRTDRPFDLAVPTLQRTMRHRIYFKTRFEHADGPSFSNPGGADGSSRPRSGERAAKDFKGNHGCTDGHGRVRQESVVHGRCNCGSKAAGEVRYEPRRFLLCCSPTISPGCC